MIAKLFELIWGVPVRLTYLNDCGDTVAEGHCRMKLLEDGTVKNTGMIVTRVHGFGTVDRCLIRGWHQNSSLRLMAPLRPQSALPGDRFISQRGEVKIEMTPP